MAAGWGTGGRRRRRPASCCSPARAASARPPRRRPPRCAAPMPGCARWRCRPTRPTRWATPSTCRSARWSAPVADGLWAQQLDAQDRMEDAWAEIQRYLLEVFRWAGVEGLEAEELSVLPGPRRGLRPRRHQAARHHGRLGRGRGRLRPHGRDDPPAVAARRARPVHGAGLPGRAGGSTGWCRRCWRGSRACRWPATRCSPPPSASTTASTGVRELLTDGRRTSVRLVVNPERMVIAEARRTHTYLSLFGYRVDAVVANRLLPDDVDRPVVRPLEGGARRAPGGHRGGLRPGAGAAGAAAADRAGGARRPARVRRRPLRRRGPDGPLRRRRADRGRGAGATTGPRARPAVRRPRRPRAGPAGDELLVRVGPYRRALVLPDAPAGGATVGGAAAAASTPAPAVTFVDAEAARRPAGHGAAATGAAG